ncbi:MAG: hypothetical protein ACPGSB_09605, partial [Opitutales bacterium]
MKFLDTLEKRFGHMAVPNVVLVLIVAQLFIYAFILNGRVDYGALVLAPKLVFAGEWWRLASFMIAPPDIATGAFSALFLAIFWYIFWMMSSALESAWGVFRFNLFLLAGILLTVAGAFIGQAISPSSIIVVDPRFLYLSVFFAFATIHPNIQFLFMFIIPVKVKWLAWLAAVLWVALPFLAAPSMGWRIMILAPIINYALFFKDSLKQSMQAKQRRAKFDTERRATMNEALHTCAACGATDKSDPDRDFRYKTV